MALHAGFATALSFDKQLLQSFIHAGYVNNLIPGRIKGTTSSYGNGDVAYDFTMQEPVLSLDDPAGKFVGLSFDLIGTLTFTGSGKPTRVTTVRVKLSMLGAVIAVVAGGSIQFGLDTASAALTSFSSEILGGDDPVPDYGFNPAAAATATLAIQALKQGTPKFMLTPPQLAHFAKLKYKLGPLGVRVTGDSLNIGVDIEDKTNGDASQLVDLNRVSTAKGWKKTLHQAVHTADDEYGAPIYEPQWGQTVLRTAGKHNTAVAVALNEDIFQDIFFRIGRYKVFAAFETRKYQAVQQQLAPMAGSSPKTTYEPSTLSLTALDQLSLGLHTDYVQVKGVGSTYTSVAMHADFALKLRIVHTYFDGNTAFLYDYAQADGITGERYDVSLSDPDWTAGMVVLGIFTGVFLLPDASAVALAMNAVAEMLVGTVVGGLLGQFQNDLVPAVLDSLSGFHTTMTYKLPATSGPAFGIRCNDVVVRPSGITAWFDVKATNDPARIYLKAAPNGTGSGPVEQTTWSAVNLAPIVVRFTAGGGLYNPSDTKVRIKWSVYAGGLNPFQEKDVLLSTGGVAAKEIAIDHASDALIGVTKFVVRCRVYRPWANTTETLFQQELGIKIVDKLDLTHPYVRWNHTVHYQGYSAKVGDPDRHATGWETVNRKSRIHYTNPKKRCRFADGFSVDVEPEYLDTLPFPLASADQHREVICVYCFFGGPDKHVLK